MLVSTPESRLLDVVRQEQTVYEHDVLHILLGDTRSVNTRLAYQKDINLFFQFSTGSSSTPDLISQFLILPRAAAVTVVLKYKAECISQGLAEATVNRRLAAIKALVRMGNKTGACLYSLDDIKGEKLSQYRDTSGVDISTFNQVLGLPNLNTAKGKRDYALLHLLWSNALRRGEVAKLRLADLDVSGKRLRIFGKGRGTQSQWIDLNVKTIGAIKSWLNTRLNLDDTAPIFSSLHPGFLSQPLTTTGIYKIVNEYFKGVTDKTMSPHRIRHSAITAALDVHNGDVRKVQKFSRHKRIDTLLIYDDNRQNAQGEVSNSLADLLG